MPAIRQDVSVSQGHGSASLTATPEAERDVAKAFAAAANCGIATGRVGEVATVCFRFLQVKDGAAERDACLLCVDRALARVYPPLDPLQYLTASSPRVESASPLTIVFDVQPSRAFAQEYPWKEAAQVRGDEDDNAIHHHKVDGEFVTMQSYRDALAADALTSSPHSDAREQAAAAATSEARRSARAATEATDALWVAAVTNKFSQLSGESVVKARRFYWRLAYWCAERFINEASWAKPAKAVKPGRLGAPLHKSILDAAMAMNEAALKTARPLGVPRVTHADVRGIEFDGLLVAHTRRYAYVALPYVLSGASVASGERDVLWTLVTRVPIPVQIDTGSNHSAGHKRRRRADETVAATDSDGGSKGGTPFYNKAEALLHDQQASFVELPNAAKRVVTVCVHRAHCKASVEPLEPLITSSGHATTTMKTPTLPPTCPLRFSVWLEDAALLSCHSEAWSHPQMVSEHALPTRLPARAVNTDAGASTVGGSLKSPPPAPFNGLNTFADILGALSDSCARFIQNSEKFAAVVEASPAAAPVSDSPASPKGEGAAPKPSDPTDEVETASVDSTTAVVDGDAEVNADTSVPPVTSTVVTSTPAATPTKEDDEIVWRRTAIRTALTLFTALTDTTSVHFKKLRRHQLPPGAMQTPKMDRWQDACGLTESCNVEFKYRLSKGGVVSSANVDRIRHTLAAMASTQGGAVLVGVTDRGELVGHPRGAVVTSLRTNGFCPAMVKDSVMVKELRPPLAGVTETGTSSSARTGGATDQKRSMPANWWKAARSTGSAEMKGNSTTSSAATGPFSSPSSTSPDMVITAVTVQRGQAPFYTAARNAAPYVRTCASSTLMPVHTMAVRILNHIAFGG